MRILIIGGTGRISTAITRGFIELGIDVTLFNRGHQEKRFPEDVRQITGDRYDFAAFEAQMAGTKHFDCVIEMICYTPEQAESAVRAFKGRTGHVIFCSTVDVYRKPAGRYPVTEQEPRRGNNNYGRNKILCEDIFMQAHENGDFPVTIIRPAMSYGEGGSLVEPLGKGWGTRYIDRVRKGKPIILHGDGTVLWVACHVDDVGRTFVHAAGNSATFGKAYHVTGEEWLTWHVYYQQMAAAIGAPEPRFVHIPIELLMKITPERARLLPENFGENSIYDNSAAKQDLEFRYTIPWEDGARRTIKWLEEHGQIENSDDDQFDDNVIAAWERLCNTMTTELAASD